MRAFLALALSSSLLATAPVVFASADEIDNKTSANAGRALSGNATAQAQPTDPGGQPAPSADSRSVGNAGGYSYSDKPRPGASAPARPRMPKHKGPLVHLPGFEQTADGGSRLFVALSATVPVEERKAQGSITYVLKNAGARVWNNTNALVTVHFNTPVSKAKIIPHGNDVFFVVDLRAAATPTWKITEAEDKSAMLMIDFPKGDYLSAPPPDAAKPEPAKAPPQKARGRAKGGAGPKP